MNDENLKIDVIDHTVVLYLTILDKPEEATTAEVERIRAKIRDMLYANMASKKHHNLYSSTRSHLRRGRTHHNKLEHRHQASPLLLLVHLGSCVLHHLLKDRRHRLE